MAKRKPKTTVKPTIKTASVKAPVLNTIPTGLDETFKGNLNIKYAFLDVSGVWYFQQKDAKRYLKDFKIIANPYI